jgi:hypothetical protein
MGFYGDIMGVTRPGKHTKSDIENGPVKIVDLPIYHPKKCDFPVRYVAVDQRVTTL